MSDKFDISPVSEEVRAYTLEPSQFENENGYVVYRAADRQALQWHTLPRRDGLEAFHVAGVTYHSEALKDASFAPGALLQLVPEPANPYDPHAIGVWNAARTLQAGYVPRDDAERIGKKLGKVGTVRGLSMWETMVGGQRAALRVLLVWPGARITLPGHD